MQMVLEERDLRDVVNGVAEARRPEEANEWEKCSRKALAAICLALKDVHNWKTC
jgi:hypothetical protein